MTTSEDAGEIPSPHTDGHSTTGEPRAANPAALTVAQLARMLSVPEETIRRHLAAGAPASADGHMNLMRYAAWLNSELTRNDGD